MKRSKSCFYPGKRKLCSLKLDLEIFLNGWCLRHQRYEGIFDEFGKSHTDSLNLLHQQRQLQNRVVVLRHLSLSQSQASCFRHPAQIGEVLKVTLRSNLNRTRCRLCSYPILPVKKTSLLVDLSRKKRTQERCLTARMEPRAEPPPSAEIRLASHQPSPPQGGLGLVRAQSPVRMSRSRLRLLHRSLSPPFGGVGLGGIEPYPTTA